VQGGASDIVQFVMGELFRVLKKRKTPARFLLTVHDSGLGECWDNDDVSEEIKGHLELILTEVVPNKFKWLKTPLTIDFATGYSWDKLG
jgi:DNA polymerase I-like protein with 3'-5' exonuclease and polymerase domains